MLVVPYSFQRLIWASYTLLFSHTRCLLKVSVYWRIFTVHAFLKCIAFSLILCGWWTPLFGTVWCTPRDCVLRAVRLFVLFSFKVYAFDKSVWMTFCHNFVGFYYSYFYHRSSNMELLWILSEFGCNTIIVGRNTLLVYPLFDRSVV